MKKLSPKTAAALALAAIVLVTLGGWFGFVSRQMARSTSLDEQIASARTELVTAKVSAKTTPAAQKLAVKTRLLTVAMPDAVEMPGLIRQVLGAARAANVRVDSLTTKPIAPKTGYDAVPVDVVLTGSFPGVKRFLFKLRTLAGTNGDVVRAKGRLFSVDSLEFVPGEAKLPQLTATVHLNAFVYRFASPAATPAAAETSASATEQEGMR